MITHQKFQNGNLREAAKLARNESAVSAETTMTLARAEMGRKPLDQGLSPRFEKHEVVLQFDNVAIALPISPTEIARKHALCHVVRAKPRSMWLESGQKCRRW